MSDLEGTPSDTMATPQAPVPTQQSAPTPSPTPQSLLQQQGANVNAQPFVSSLSSLGPMPGSEVQFNGNPFQAAGTEEHHRGPHLPRVPKRTAKRRDKGLSQRPLSHGVQFRDSSGSSANAPTHPTRAQYTDDEKIPDNDKTTAAVSTGSCGLEYLKYFHQNYIL